MVSNFYFYFLSEKKNNNNISQFVATSGVRTAQKCLTWKILRK